MTDATPQRATVGARHDVTPDIVLLSLRLSQSAPTPPPGSHLEVVVRLPAGPDTRSYSLVDLGRDDGLLRIAVRRHHDGRGGAVWMHTLGPGDELTVSGPVDAFPPDPGPGPQRAARRRGGHHPCPGFGPRPAHPRQ
ncbi:FAD-binding oxidoreductase [Streptomyces sp. NBC_01003]|uniref:FAD-binding oxidoreductase n=1 Tax=Streptomyces sp. NBC_01003 TaxID=2903714 RepID=UPI00386710DE